MAKEELNAIDILLFLTPLGVLAFLTFRIVKQHYARLDVEPVAQQGQELLAQELHVEAPVAQGEQPLPEVVNQPLPDAANQPDAPQEPKRLGKKRARNLAKKENIRRYNEWSVLHQQEKDRRQEILSEQRKLEYEEKERLALERLNEENELLEQQRRAESKRLRREEVEWMAKASVYDDPQKVVEYFKANVQVNLAKAAKDLDFRQEELQCFVEEHIESNEWFAFFEDPDTVVYLDPSAVHTMQSMLHTTGRVSKLQVNRLLFGHAA